MRFNPQCMLVLVPKFPMLSGLDKHPHGKSLQNVGTTGHCFDSEHVTNEHILLNPVKTSQMF